MEASESSSGMISEGASHYTLQHGQQGMQLAWYLASAEFSTGC